MLSCHRISKRYGGVVALNDVSIEVGAREVLGIVGPNGAGKTTLLDVVSGFVTPDRGTVAVNRVDITHAPPWKRAQAGVARGFQELRVFRNLTVVENVVLACKVRVGESVAQSVCGRWGKYEEARRRHAQSLLGRVGLLELGSSRAGQLSFGQQKLVMLVACAARGAALLLLDEPFAGIDDVNRSALMWLLRALRDEGRALVIIEHDTEALKSIAGDIVVMSAGAIVAHYSRADGWAGATWEALW